MVGEQQVCPFYKAGYCEAGETFYVTQRVVVRNQVIPELIQYYNLFASQISKLNYQPC